MFGTIMDSTQQLLEEVMQLERDITNLAPGDPRLADAEERVGDLEAEVRQARGVASPLLPGTEERPSTEESALANLERAVGSLRRVIEAKRVAPAADAPAPDPAAG